MEEVKEKEVEIRLKDLWAVFLRCWWIMLLVAAVVCAGVFLVLQKTHVDRYTASATVYIIRTNGSIEASQVSISNALISDYIEIITSKAVLENVRNELHISSEELPDATFRNMIEISNTDSSRLVTISVTAEDVRDAAELTDSLARNSVDYFNALLLNEKYSQYLGGVDTEHPEDSVVISNSISLFKILLFGLIAAVLVYAVFFILQIADDKINTPEDVERYLGVNLLGQIPYRQSLGRRNQQMAGGLGGEKKA